MFTTKNDEPQWKAVYGLFETATDDEVVTYDEIAAALALHPETDRVAMQGIVHQAAKRLLRDQNKALENVRGKGYRVATQVEHYTLAQRAQKKARRRLKHGHELVRNVDFNGMTTDDRKRIENGAQLIAAQLAFNRRTDLRLKDTEKAVRALGKRQDRTDDETTALRARLDRLERLIQDKED